MGFFDKIKAGLKKTRDSITGQINSMLHAFTKIDEELFEELEELLGNMTPDQLADLKDKISQMQEKDAAEPENEEVDKDADVDDASKDADTDDTDAAEGAAEKTVTADTKSE
mgnify:CR=1 FL=1